MTKNKDYYYYILLKYAKHYCKIYFMKETKKISQSKSQILRLFQVFFTAFDVAIKKL